MKKKLLIICCLLVFLMSPASVIAQVTEYSVIITNVSLPDYQDGNIVYILDAVYQVTRVYELNADGSQTPVEVDLGQIVVGPTGARFTTSIKGGYVFKQVKRAPGYLLVNEPFQIEFPQMANGVVSPDQTVEIMHKAIPVIGDVELLKVDPSGKTLAGAIFELWQLTAPGQDVTLPRKIGDTYVSDPNGLIRITNLPEGSYEFREIQPPAGFEPITTPLGFTIDPDLGLPVRIELRFENCPLPTATPPLTTTPTNQPSISPTPQPSKSPTPQPSKSPTPQPSKSPTPQPTKPPVNPPNTGELTEYIMFAVGAILLGIFFVITWCESKAKREEN